ncbi:Putative sodium-coupled neutral amino acid transporter 11 [Seminavis robusta]|uniref:Sodium-coupled neutral amino acid transporter 11 n=1 Tax=Seminavis robusta TaxID=568900 RepID=A0A9N8EYK8_9STRA|nr:Putative sodium-coupled neutral amino acid transporter 11 [Seminavis robusta]|eukprot:Sro2898_g339710.1 Putative sodium-coupled neutral amino acid transporter 11 (503) ;mRNA; r:5893-7808
MSGLAENNNKDYGATSDEQEVCWNEEAGRASLLNNSSNGSSSNRRNSVRESILIMRQSIRESTANLVRSSITLSFGGRQCSVRSTGGTATIATEFFNLVKNLVGAGMLAIPNGVAAFADAPSALLPGAFFTFLMGAIFGYYFTLIGRTCRLTHTATYREVWEQTMGDGQSLAIIVSLVNMTKPALGNLAYSMILADTFRSLFAAVQVEVSRTMSLLLITFLGLLPLCLLKNLSVLAPTSMLGVFGFAATTVVMGIRYFDGSYAEGGKFATDMEEKYQPVFGNQGASAAWTNPKVLVLVCMLFEAFVAHYNAPRFYTELKNNTVQRYALMTTYSFGASSLIYFLVMVFGFLTFGKACDGYILNNYSNNDPMATFCRLCVAMALVCTYPIVFVGVRDAFLDLCKIPMEKHTSTNLNIVSVFLLTIITAIAASITDLGLVNAVGGGTLGTIVVFVFPAIMFRAAVEQQHPDDIDDGSLWEVNFAIALMWFGIILGIVGVYMAVTE